MVRIFSLFLFSLAFVPITHAEQVRDNGQQDPLLVSSDFWRSQMEKKMPQTLCEPDGEFVGCHKVSEDECNKQVKTWSRECLARLETPKQLNVSIEGEIFGFKAGQCVGKKFSEKYQKTRSSDHDCQISRSDED